MRNRISIWNSLTCLAKGNTNYKYKGTEFTSLVAAVYNWAKILSNNKTQCIFPYMEVACPGPSGGQQTKMSP